MRERGKWRPAFIGVFFAIIGGGGFLFIRVSADGAAAARADNLFPSVVAMGLFLAGLVTASRGFRDAAADATDSRSRACILVIGSVVAFAAIIGRGGLLPAIFVCVLISAFGSRHARLGQSIVLGLCVAVAIAVLFVGLLGQPIKLIAGPP